MSTALDLACIGELMREIYFPFSEFPAKNTTLVSSTPGLGFGGPVINLTWYTTRLGLKVLPVCASGVADAATLGANLASMGAPDTGIMSIQETSDLLFSFLDSEHNHYSYYVKGAFIREISAVDVLRGTNARFVVLCGGRHPQFRDLFREIPTRYPGPTYIFNPSYAVFLYTREELQAITDAVDLIFLNESEAEYVLNTLKMSDIRELCKNSDQTVVVASGREGVRAVQGEQAFEEKSYAKRVINPIGGGDSLLAGIAYSIATGGNLKEALRFGSALAALVVESDAVRIPIAVGDIEERLRQVQGRRTASP